VISYRDMCFCRATTCIKFGDGKCPRSLTPAVQKAANDFGLPIAEWTEPKDQPCYSTEEEPPAFDTLPL
jgi:hypothetical protein